MVERNRMDNSVKRKLKEKIKLWIKGEIDTLDKMYFERDGHTDADIDHLISVDGFSNQMLVEYGREMFTLLIDEYKPQINDVHLTFSLSLKAIELGVEIPYKDINDKYVEEHLRTPPNLAITKRENLTQTKLPSKHEKYDLPLKLEWFDDMGEVETSSFFTMYREPFSINNDVYYPFINFEVYPKEVKPAE